MTGSVAAVGSAAPVVAGDEKTNSARATGTGVQGGRPSATVPTPPATTHTSRMEALRIANRVREHRATVKRILRTLPRDKGEAAVAFILQVPDPLEWTWRVRDLLMAIHGYGVKRVNRILITTQTTTSRTVAGLSPRQRTEIIQHLRGGNGTS